MVISAALIIFWSLAVAAWSARKRRYTWDNHWERGATLTIWLMAASAAFMASVIDAPIDLLPDDWDALPGVTLSIAAAVSINHVVAHRAYPQPGPHLRRIKTTAGIAAVTLTVIFLNCGLWQKDKTDYLNVAMPPEGKMWWLIYDLTLGGLLAVAAWTVIKMCKEDDRHEPTGRAYIVSCLAGIVGATVGAAATFTRNHVLAEAVSPLFGIWVMTFSIASAQSWKRRVKPFDDLLRVVRPVGPLRKLAMSDRRAGIRE